MSGRGLGQGFPLSPYMFILCAQGLSWMIRKMEENCLYNGYIVNSWAPSISRLMSADDLLFFGTLGDRTIQNLQDILYVYAKWSGQQENLEKSSILFSKGVTEERRNQVAEFLGVKQMQGNDKYLGFQLLKSTFRIDSFDFLFEKIENKLAGWKIVYLNHAGKTVLIKHVLGLIPPYYMATSLLPKDVIARLERIIMKLWWGYNYTTMKNHFINWNVFLDKKVNGGLGIRSLIHLNRAQIAKLG